MSKLSLFLVAMLFAGCVGSVFAATSDQPEAAMQAPRYGEMVGDIPARAGSGTLHRGFGDTLRFGYIDGAGFAVLDDIWTFDHGGPEFEGWYATDVTEQSAEYFRWIDASVWSAGGNEVLAPILSGDGSAWIGAFEDEADAMCWASGLGYGNRWCQKLVSPTFLWVSEVGGATLNLTYFNDTESEYDYTRVLIRRGSSGEEETIPPGFEGWDGPIGLATDHPASPPDGASGTIPITDADLGGETSYQIEFEFESDGAWSDEDGLFAIEYGPFAADDVQVTGAASSSPLYAFETGLDGWTPEACPGEGTFLGVKDVTIYTLQDPCACELDGNVLEMHDDDLSQAMVHPDGQHVQARTNPVDIENHRPGDWTGTSIFGQWDQYSEMPRANGVFYRPGWDYYPFLCQETGGISWSGRAGQGTYFFVGDDPLCTGNITSATENGIPQEVEQIRFVFELNSSCAGFGIDPTDCSNENNFTPIIDNIQIGIAENPDAPSVRFDNGMQYQDGFAQELTLSTTQPGRADCSRNVNFGDTPPIVLETVPRVDGPVVTPGNEYDVEMHVRVVREGPGADGIPAWGDWKARVGMTSVGDWVEAFMDTVEISGFPITNQYLGYFREDNPAFDPSFGELTAENEIIVDRVPPGTAFEYYFTTRYTDMAQHPSGDIGYYPAAAEDPDDPAYFEFEILPSWRMAGSYARFPCILYVDAYNRGAQSHIEAALGRLLGDEEPPRWDRYDYLDAHSNWVAPMARGGAGSNNGVPLPQLIGYRAILFNTGVFDDACWPSDYILLNDWLTDLVCNGNINRQGLIMNGDKMGSALLANGRQLLNNRLGADVDDEGFYSDHVGVGDSDGLPDHNYCVRLEDANPGLYASDNSEGDYGYDAWGNWCPHRFEFNVLEEGSGGVGNRVFEDIVSGDRVGYAQIAREELDREDGNYRTVLDAVSYHHLSSRVGTGPDTECSNDSSAIVTASHNEMLAALEWIFDGSVPTGLCDDPCLCCDAVPGQYQMGPTARLYQNTPNPFNPRTQVRFTLAQKGRVEVSIYDVRGRKVRTLVQAELEAGVHSVTWDGMDDTQRLLASGVYWSRLEAGEFRSNKKMILLKQ